MIKSKLLIVIVTITVLLLAVSSCSPMGTTNKVQLPPPTVTTLTVAETSVILNTPAPTTTPSPTATQDSRYYLVEYGDSLWSISLKTGIPIAFIALANGIVNTDVISAGQTLFIPESNSTPPDISETGKEIVVVLSTQMLYVYEGGQSIMEFLVSTGLPDSPTPLGLFSIQSKYEKVRMVGPGYDLPDVPWTMYFYEDYGIHGAYWHNNFGHPMSHGCVNMRVDDAKLVYDWAPIGTPVLILP